MQALTLPELVLRTVLLLVAGAGLVLLVTVLALRLYRVWRRIRRTVHDLGDWLLWHG